MELSPFFLSKYGMSQGQWTRSTGGNPSMNSAPGSIPNVLLHPVENVSWEDVRRFLTRLNERFGKSVFVLPTEAQWEYACRADTTTCYAFGDRLTAKQARFSVGVMEGTKAVGSYSANDWGLFDMHGNVWEWCQDYRSSHYQEADPIDPTGPSTGPCRVLRGGTWSSVALMCRSATRNRLVPTYRNSVVGFRVSSGTR